MREITEQVEADEDRMPKIDGVPSSPTARIFKDDSLHRRHYIGIVMYVKIMSFIYLIYLCLVLFPGFSVLK